MPDTRQPGTQSVGPRPASPSALVLVRQLAGRTVLLAHGDQDRVTDPERSYAYAYAYALRARQVSDQVCRFDVPGDGHAMLRRRRDWRFIPRPPRRGPT
ncbi:MAG: hypothetical protein QOC83_971 [Pseudonocardiales bacterium]|nr:hypothetical protein [Pseudonocardiales bacterium]